MTLGNTTIKGNLRPKMTKEEQAWVKQELAEQIKRYEKIVQEMEAISDQREKWVADFLQRIQTRGFNVHSNIRRVIKKDEIRPRDGRPLQVVF